MESREDAEGGGSSEGGSRLAVTIYIRLLQGYCDSTTVTIFACHSPVLVSTSVDGVAMQDRHMQVMYDDAIRETGLGKRSR